MTTCNPNNICYFPKVCECQVVFPFILVVSLIAVSLGLFIWWCRK